MGSLDWLPVYTPAVAVCALVAFVLWWATDEYAMRFDPQDWRSWALPAVAWSVAINVASILALKLYTLYEPGFDEARFRSAMIIPYCFLLGATLNGKVDFPIAHPEYVNSTVRALLSFALLYPWVMVNDLHLLLELALVSAAAILVFGLAERWNYKRRGKRPPA